MPTALICGVSGQDGAYLAQLLLGKGYVVYGSSRDTALNTFSNLERLGIREKVKTVSIGLNDFRSVLHALVNIEPDEVYNLAGQSSVALSFEQPVETLESIAHATLNLLEAIRFTRRQVRFYNACSSECFGDTGTEQADETSPFRPRSPYGVAKATAFWQVANYREAYGLFACSGILFNHESPLRPARFVTRKVVSAACRIAEGSDETLSMGNLTISRDWGWAPEYVEAMWRMLQIPVPDDFLIATGQSHKLEDFVARAFEVVGLDWRKHVQTDASLLRPTDLLCVRGNPSKAARVLKWTASKSMKDIVDLMVQAECHPGRIRDS